MVPTTLSKIAPPTVADDRRAKRDFVVLSFCPTILGAQMPINMVRGGRRCAETPERAETTAAADKDALSRPAFSAFQPQ